MKALLLIATFFMAGQVFAQNYQTHRPCVKWATVEDSSGELGYRCVKRGPAQVVKKPKCVSWGVAEDASGESQYMCVEYTQDSYPVKAKPKCLKWGTAEDSSGESQFMCIKRASH